MARYLFIAQNTLDTWMDQDKIEFDGDMMTIKADKRKFKLVEAVRFVRVEGGDDDTNGLIGKVKTNEQLDQLGAERYMDSVLYKDVAYKVQEGFIGEVFLSKTEKVITLSTPKKKKSDDGQNDQGKPVSRSASKPDTTKLSKELQAARTELEMKKVPDSPPSLPRSPSASPRPAPSKKIAGNQPDTKQGESVEGMSDEELLTRFLLDNL